MNAVDFVEISKHDAITAVTTDSWTQERPELATCGHRGCEDHPGGVQRIHTLSPKGLGADWDLTDAVAFIESSARCGWIVAGFSMGHDLLVADADGYRIRFEVKRPAEVTA